MSPKLDPPYLHHTGLRVGHCQRKTLKYHCCKVRNSQTMLSENLLWKKQIMLINELWGSFNICHGLNQGLQKIHQYCCQSLTRLTTGTEYQKVQRLEFFSFFINIPGSRMLLEQFWYYNDVTIIRLNKIIVAKVIPPKIKCCNFFFVKISTHVFLLITY